MQPLPPPKERPKRLMGIDFGMSRLGIALSDERQVIAMPCQTLLAEKETKQTAAKIFTLVEELEKVHASDIEEIVVGLPLMLSGRIGAFAEEVIRFVSLLSGLTLIPIQTWDERLTTAQAERSLRETKMSRKKRSKGVDVVSATIILQSYLDHKQLRIYD